MAIRRPHLDPCAKQGLTLMLRETMCLKEDLLGLHDGVFRSIPDSSPKKRIIIIQPQGHAVAIRNVLQR